MTSLFLLIRRCNNAYLLWSITLFDLLECFSFTDTIMLSKSAWGGIPSKDAHPFDLVASLRLHT